MELMFEPVTINLTWRQSQIIQNFITFAKEEMEDDEDEDEGYEEELNELEALFNKKTTEPF